MLANKYLCINGHLIAKSNPIDDIGQYVLQEFVLLERLRSNGSNILFFDNHFSFIEKKIAGMMLPLLFEKKQLQAIINNLLTKNRVFKGGIIDIYINKNADYIIQTTLLGSEFFPNNNTGITIDIFDGINKPIHYFSSLEQAYPHLYIAANQYATKKKLDDLVLINRNKALTGTVSASLFIVKENGVQCPPIADGAPIDVMRNLIIEILKKNNLAVQTNQSIFAEDLLAADECFLADIQQGIRWVVAYKHKRYFCKLSKWLSGEINRRI